MLSEQQVTRHWEGATTQPIVTILCHAYNQIDFVEAAITSLIRQVTNFPFEIILRDDGSTDGTAEVIRRFSAAYPTIVRAVLEPTNQYQLGIRPLAATFPLARGEFVAFCEADDYWIGTDRLQTQVDYLRDHPDHGLVHGNYLNLIHIAGAWQTRLAFRTPRQLQGRAGDIYPDMLQANRIQTCTAVCRQSLVREYRQSGPGVDRYHVGDWPMFLYIAGRSRVAFIERPIAAYRKAPGSMTNIGAKANLERSLNAVQMINDFCDHFGSEATTRDSGLAAQYRVILWQAVCSDDPAAFSAASAWLRAHRPEQLRSLWVTVLRMVIGVPAARRALVFAYRLVERTKHRVEFRLESQEAWQK